MSKMNKKSIAFFNSNDIYPVSADSTLPFEQHRDIFYLSGVDQEESVLMLCPSASDPKYREVLFLKETDDHIAVWEGPKLNKEQAYETSGIKTVYWLDEMEKVIDEVSNEFDTIYYNHNEHYRAKIEMETREERFNKWIENKFPNFSYNVALSEPMEEDNWSGHTGFIHQVLHDEYLKNHEDPTEIEYYMCGPPPMINACDGMLDSLGVDKEMIAYDSFG